VTAVGVAAAPLLIYLFAPGFAADATRAELAVDMLRLTFPYLLFVSLTAFAGAVLNTHRRFAVPAFTPVLLNVVLIVFAAWIAPRMERPGVGLAFGVFVAGAAQLVFQAPFLIRLRLLPRPRWGWSDPGVRRVLRLMMPTLFGSSVAQINILINTIVASFLAAGSISWLYYSDRLMEFPLGVFGIALATVILPHLAEHHARASSAAFVDTLDWALRWVLVIGLPAAVALFLLAEPLLVTIFYGGAFNTLDVEMGAASLRAFAPGLIGFILVKVLASAYFARQDTRTPVLVGLRALLLNVTLNAVFVLGLLETGWAPAHAGLAFATTVAALFNGGMLLRGLVASGIYRTRCRWRGLSLQVAGGCATMAAMLALTVRAAGDWTALAPHSRIGWLAVCVAGGAAVYFAACAALGLRVRVLRSVDVG
jgi:putative peptidoglycan lipid II flippase